MSDETPSRAPDFGLLARRLIQRVVAEWPHYASTPLADDIMAMLRQAWTMGDTDGIHRADLQRHMILTLSDMGVEDGKTLQDVQRRLHVETPTAMRLFALLNAAKALAVVGYHADQPVSEAGSSTQSASAKENPFTLPPEDDQARPVGQAREAVLVRMSGGYGTQARRVDEETIDALVAAVRADPPVVSLAPQVQEQLDMNRKPEVSSRQPEVSAPVLHVERAKAAYLAARLAWYDWPGAQGDEAETEQLQRDMDAKLDALMAAVRTSPPASETP